MKDSDKPSDNQNPINKELFIDALLREVAEQESYHNHKEKMAWTGSSLYFLFTVAFDAWMFKQTFNFCCGLKAGIGIVLFLILVSGGIFIWMQFKMRWNSTDINWVLRRTVYLLISGKPVSDFIKTEEPTLQLTGDKDHPEKIQEAIVELHKRRNCKNWFKDPRFHSELTTYALMIVLFASQILILLFW